ncbi:hypothetical protein [Gordonia rubripertincta]|uniref:Restriction endonuclease n=1 Tax=Gordonia rubripertincta TaxID=36822 RepID=A0ABT4MTA8_GORRU|nr:hypothetical protein [Gordonia rubripertincta]MCZ4550245.1 hypothetical protein [Gordonia rubripertincta]
MSTYNESERPRVAVLGCDKDHPVAEAVKQYAGSVFFGEVDTHPWIERDAVVLWQVMGDILPYETSHLRVLSFGGAPQQPVATQFYKTPRLMPQLGDEFSIPEECPDELKKLVKTSLIPYLQRRTGMRVVIDCSWEPTADRAFYPILKNSSGSFMSAIYSNELVSESWWISVDENEEFEFAVWINAAFDRWHSLDPKHFPGPPEWTRSEEWLTTEELAALDEVNSATAELERTIERLEGEVESKIETLRKLHLDADEGARVLLTGGDDELVLAVEAMLTRIGFTVDNRDKSKTGQRLEDLHILDPESTWKALAEVKGHTNGGKPGDLQKATRFAALYEGANGKKPDATWCVVNQFREKSPATRRELLSSHPEDVDSFAIDSNGAVIDTVDLFLLDRSVARGDITDKDARQLLINANKRFTYRAE